MMLKESTLVENESGTSAEWIVVPNKTSAKHCPWVHSSTPQYLSGFKII